VSTPRISKASTDRAASEAFTPRAIVDAARRTLGAIHLDPASCALANEVVGAGRYFDAANDGLTLPWEGNVFLNPPGGKVRGRSVAAQWWAKLYRSWRNGDVPMAIFVAFNLGVFRTSQSDIIEPGPTVLPPFLFPMCVPAKRLRYDRPVDGARVAGTKPPQDSAIILLPPRLDVTEEGRERARIVKSRFAFNFQPFGCVGGVP
jgi:hypothetical protein